MAEVRHPEAYARAIRANIIANARITWERENAEDGNQIISFLSGAAEWSTFAQSLHTSFYDYGKLSPAQTNAARGMMQKALARDTARQEERSQKYAEQAAKSSHVGTIGVRQDFTLTIGKVLILTGFYGTSYMHLCTDGAGNAIVYKGTTELGEQGETVNVKATIKEHSLYNGVSQTVINRPKVLTL